MKAAIRKPDGKVDYLALLAEDHDEARSETCGRHHRPTPAAAHRQRNGLL